MGLSCLGVEQGHWSEQAKEVRQENKKLEQWHWLEPPEPMALHQEKIHLLENGLKVLKMAFQRPKSSQAK